MGGEPDLFGHGSRLHLGFAAHVAAEQYAVLGAEAAVPDDPAIGREDRRDAEREFRPFGQQGRQVSHSHCGRGGPDQRPAPIVHAMVENARQQQRLEANASVTLLRSLMRST